MKDWKYALMQIPGVRQLSSVRTYLVAHWFDLYHRVKTCGVEYPHELRVIGGNASHAIAYIPTTPSCGRHMLRDLPISDVSSYTFLDIGSGKGRMLLLAAELPFRRVVGVEFAADLDEIARRNVTTYRNPNQRCFRIEPIHADATQFEFPNEPTILYFFYPFDESVMRPVIENLDRSLVEHPRDVIVVYRNPVLSSIVDEAMRLRVLSRREYFGSPYFIYRS